MGGEGVLFPSLSALSDAININLGVCLKRACPACETRAVPLSHLSIKYLLNTLVPSMFYFSIKLGTSPKEEVFADHLISKRVLFTQWIQMAPRGCKHLLCAPECLVITSPPSSSLQMSYETWAFNLSYSPNLLPGRVLFLYLL